MKCIRQADHRDRDQINALRVNEFNRSNQFTLLKPDKLLWNSCDDESVVLSAWDGTRVVATMRAVVVHNAPEASTCAQCTIPPDALFPAVIFNSAATDLEYRGLGLNQALRYHFLKMALDSDVQALLSPMYQGAPRIRFMEALGYRFSVPQLSWQDKLNPKTTRIMGIMPQERMACAMQMIEMQRRDIIRTYPWHGETAKFQIRMLNVASHR